MSLPAYDDTLALLDSVKDRIADLEGGGDSATILPLLLADLNAFAQKADETFLQDHLGLQGKAAAILTTLLRAQVVIEAQAGIYAGSDLDDILDGLRAVIDAARAGVSDVELAALVEEGVSDRLASLAPGDIGAVPVTRTIDGIALSANVTLPEATTSVAGKMSAADKVKLNGVATGALGASGVAELLNDAPVMNLDTDDPLPRRVVMLGDKIRLDPLFEVDARWYGAVCDYDLTSGTGTDSIAGIQKAITVAAALSRFDGTTALRGGRVRLLLPEGDGDGYAVSAAVTVPHGIDIVQGAPLVYTGSGNVTTLTIGATNTTDTNARHIGLAAVRKTRSDWTNEGSIGIRLYRLTSSEVHVREARQFTIGLQCNGEGAGFAYNAVHLGELSSNKVQLDLTSDNGGWCNENDFYGGRLACYTLDNPTRARIGVRLWSGDGYKQNGNQFFKPSIELKSDVATGDCLGFLWENARLNKAWGPRFENVDATYRTLNDSIDNDLIAGFGGIVEERREDGLYVGGMQTQSSLGTRDQPTRLLVFDSGPLPVVAGRSQADTHVYVPGMHWQSGFNLAHAVAGLNSDPKTGYVEVVGSSALGVRIACGGHRRFVVHRDLVEGYEGRVMIKCYDASGTLLDNTDPGHPYVKGHPSVFTVSWSANHGGGYRTGSDSSYDAVFEVGEDVAAFDVLVTPGTANARLQRLMVWAVEPRGWAGFGNVRHAPTWGSDETGKGRPAWEGLLKAYSAPTAAGRFEGDVRQNMEASSPWGWMWDGSNWRPINLGYQAAYVNPATATAGQIATALINAGAMASS